MQLLHEFVHQAAHVADRADRLRVRHPRRAEDADDTESVAALAVRGEYERNIAHLRGLVLCADDHLDVVSRRQALNERAEVVSILEHREHAAELFGLAELWRFHHVQQAV